MLFLFVSAALAAPCTAPTRVEAVTSQVPLAQIAMSSFDEDGFRAAVAAASDALPCLAEPVAPLDAAAFHGLMGLSASFAGREDDAVRAFAAARSDVPGFRLPAVIAPAGGTVDALLEKAGALPQGEAQVLPPYDGVVLVDGSRALLRPTWRPCLLQLVRSNGSVERTYYLRGGDALPHWDPPPTAFQRLIPKVREKPSLPLGIAAGGTAVAAGTLYALGGTWSAQFHDPATPYSELEGLQTQTNVALGASIALGVAAVALGTVTVVHW